MIGVMFKLVVFQGDRLDAQSSAFLFAQQINQAAAQSLAKSIRYADLVFTFKGGKCEVQSISLGKPVETLAEAYYVRDYHNYQAERYALAAYLDGCGHKVFNSDALHNESLSKLEQLVIFTKANIPVPTSSFASDASLVQPVSDYPYVLKSITASNNRLNYLVHNEPERQKALQAIGSKVLAQQYIENDGDYKVILMYGQPLAIYKRSKPNVYERSRPHRYRVNEADVAALAQKTARILGREFCGVDIVRDKATGMLYVLECNFNAGLYMAGLGIDKDLFINTIRLMD